MEKRGSKRVALVNPNRLLPAVAPVGLEYLAPELERNGAEVRILDLCPARRPHEAIREFFHAYNPDLVGVTVRNMDDVVYNCFLAEEMRPLVQTLKSCAGAPLVLGGSGFSIAPELMLDYLGVDLGISGEGEAALPMLLERLDSPEDWAEVPGLIWRQDSGFRRNLPATCDLRSLRLCKRNSIPHEEYAQQGKRRCSIGVQTKRGCPNNCIYCVVPNIEGREVRARDPREIADEMENLAARGVKRVFLADGELNYPMEHAVAVCEEFIRRDMASKLTWQGYASPGRFDARLARLMKDAGCDLLIATVDSGDDALLERWNKPFRTEDTVKFIRACQESGLNATYCLTLGGPGETIDTVLKTLTLMRSLKPAKVTLGEPPGLRIYPNTPLADIAREEGFAPSNPNLRGHIRGNQDLLRPVYYISAGMGVLSSMIQLWRKVGEVHHRIVRR